MNKLVLLLIGTLGLVLQSANAQILFTTLQDFSTNDSWGAGAVTTFDYDAQTVNGVGNTSNPGGAGTGGSLQLNAVTSGWGPIIWGPGLTAQSGAALDGPGWVQPYSAASGYGAGAIAAASGVLTMTYTMPDSTLGGTYFQPAIWYNYPGGWGGWFASSEIDLGPVNTPNGQMEMFQATIPYSISAVALGSSWGFQLGIGRNTDYSGANPWYVDQIAISVGPVPEPGVIVLVGIGLTGVALIRRQRRS